MYACLCADSCIGVSCFRDYHAFTSMQEQMNANNGFFDASKLDLSGIKADVKATPKTRQPKGEL